LDQKQDVSPGLTTRTPLVNESDPEKGTINASEKASSTTGSEVAKTVSDGLKKASLYGKRLLRVFRSNLV
jgi:hypothetical protein